MFVGLYRRHNRSLRERTAEQVFGRLKDEFFHGRNRGGLESFRSDLEAFMHYWSHVRRQVKLEGLIPAEFREQALRGSA